jgi:phospholipid/cholesterol/gamma-HCH transport system substrate-binding protein
MSKTRRLIRMHAGPIVTIISFGILSTAVLGYIVLHERVQNPFQGRYTVNVDLATASATAPGFGQPVTVSGVKVGTITGVRAAAGGGYAVITATIVRSQLSRLYANATAVLAPRTPLRDMELDLDPGGPPARPLASGGTVPLGNSVAPINSDEFQAAFDGDTRSFVELLLDGLGAGLHQRGPDFRDVLRLFRPTVYELDELNTAIASRRADLARLIHNLNVLTGSIAAEDPSLARFVARSGRTLAASAEQDSALGTALGELPGTLAEVRTSLPQIGALSDAARAAAEAQLPTTPFLRPALQALNPVLSDTARLLRLQVHPLATEALPFLQRLTPSVARLTDVTPSLTSAFRVLEYLDNETAYNGSPDKSYLFWGSWAWHNFNGYLDSADAVGDFARSLTVVGCDTASSDPSTKQLFQALAGPAMALCPANPTK